MSKLSNQARSLLKNVSAAKRVWNVIKNRKLESEISSMEEKSAPIKEATEIIPGKIAFFTNSFSYSGNPKYIYEEIIRRNLNYDMIWITKKGADIASFPDGVKTVLYDTPDGIREIYSCNLWIDNAICFSNYFEKKQGQIHLQTMHGSLGIKRLDNSVTSRLKQGKYGRKVVYRESNETDYVLTDSKFEEDVFRAAFWKDTKMVRLGHARTDALFNIQDSTVSKVKNELLERYGIPLDSKIVLFAPTHRKGMTSKDINIGFKEAAQAFKQRFGGEFAILMRLHGFTKGIVWDHEDIKHFYDVTDYPDIQELMIVTDIAITDYSSWIYDYVLMHRPGFIYASDLEKYNTQTQLCYPLEETPFPVAHNSGELLENIKNFDTDLYERRVNEFLDEKQAMDDGGSAKRAVDFITELVPPISK